MKLKLELSDKELLLYREKWGAIAYISTLAVACLAIAVGAYFLSGQADTPTPFLIAFSLLFGFAGAALLLRLPVESKKIVDDGGAHVFSADSWGVSITANLGARKQSVLWTSIEEVVLSKRLKIIEFSETTYVGRAVIVYLRKDEYDAWSVSDRINSGASRSSGGRPYLHVPFAGSQESPLTEALRQFAPALISVRSEELTVFDFKKNADSNLNA